MNIKGINNFADSSLSYLEEVNEGNVEPSVLAFGSPVVFDTASLASASRSQEQGLASPEAQLRQVEGSAEQRQKENAAGAASPTEAVPAVDVWPRHGAESAVAHIRLQLWDRRPVRGTPFRGKAEIRLPNRRVTGFINFTEGRKWFAKRQDREPDTQHWYEWYRETIAAGENAHDGDRDYRPRIGHMIKRPQYGKPTEQIPQSGGILTWEVRQPTVVLMINDFYWSLPMRRSKHAPGPKTPDWYAYWQPRHEEEEDEEYFGCPTGRSPLEPENFPKDINNLETADRKKRTTTYSGQETNFCEENYNGKVIG